MKYISKDGKTAMMASPIRKRGLGMMWGIVTLEKQEGRWVPSDFYRSWVFNSEEEASKALDMLSDGLEMTKGE